jgi:hypothetical protein
LKARYKSTPKGAIKGEGKPLQRMPSKLERDAAPKPNNGDAIAMRRIIVERGFWLAPSMSGQAVPVLSEWELTVDLCALDKAIKNRSSSSRIDYSKSDAYLSSID